MGVPLLEAAHDRLIKVRDISWAGVQGRQEEQYHSASTGDSFGMEEPRIRTVSPVQQPRTQTVAWSKVSIGSRASVGSIVL